MSEAASLAASGRGAEETGRRVGVLEMLRGNGKAYLSGLDAKSGWWVRDEGWPGLFLTALDLAEWRGKLNAAEDASEVGVSS